MGKKGKTIVIIFESLQTKKLMPFHKEINFQI